MANPLAENTARFNRVAMAPLTASQGHSSLRRMVESESGERTAAAISWPSTGPTPAQTRAEPPLAARPLSHLPARRLAPGMNPHQSAHPSTVPPETKRAAHDGRLLRPRLVFANGYAVTVFFLY